tara:strand:- start:284 stop:1258 length:975 start_codon:yes stop_codon:yes gene_type:complete
MISVLGDVYLDKKYNVNIDLDKFIFNLEYPITKSITPVKNKIVLHQENSFIKDTFKKNPTAVCLNNNHIFDYGLDGVQQTIEFLNQNNISYFGVGNEKNNYNNPYSINDQKITYDFYGYCCTSTNPFIGNEKISLSLIDVDRIKRDIVSSKSKGNTVTIILHWGDEEVKYPKPSDIRIARKLIDFGADLVLGHHAHVIQSYEIYKEKKIFYGLGNFIFPDLDIPSHFNGKNFEKKYIKQQSDENRKSIVIDIPNKNELNVRKTFFKKGVIDLYDFKINKYLIESNFLYETYKFFYFRAFIIKKFIKSPKIPSIEQILIFAGLKK